MYIFNIIAAALYNNDKPISNDMFIIVIFDIVTTTICMFFLIGLYKHIKIAILNIVAIIMVCFYIFNYVYSSLIINAYIHKLNTNLYNLSIAIIVTNTLGLCGWVLILDHIQAHL